MSELRTDAQLVTAYLAGDRSALAGMYDRFSPGLYDTAAAMLRDRHEAADAMQDVFLIAAERLGQLREPERLKPWLYAILRNEVYRRSRKRGRALPTDFTAMANSHGHGVEMAAPIAPDAEGEAVSAAELAELVRSAACGLDERDQLVLELSVRQGLQGADLAAALGVSAEQSYTLVHRMRERVDRSLGALVVARAGRKDCPDLADILRGWDGEFTVLIRKRVARHVENCETCERTKKKAAPLALVASGTAFAAPPSLRDVILSKAGTPGAAPKHAYEFDADGGFPRLVRHLRLPTAVLGGSLAILLGIGGGALVAAQMEDSPPPPPAETTVVDTTVPDTVDSTIPTVTTEVTTTSTTPPVTPGSLVVGATNVDLGATEVSRAVDLFNPGGTPVDFVVKGSLGPFTISLGGGTVQPGAHVPLVVSIDRSPLKEGDYATVLSIVAADVTNPLKLRARVEHPPVVTMVAAPTGKVCFVAFTYSPSLFFRAQIADESSIRTPVTVSVAGPTPVGTQMTWDGDWYGSISTAGMQTGNYNWTVTVKDVRGNTTIVTGSFYGEASNCV